jgi:hypothetical protein
MLSGALISTRFRRGEPWWVVRYKDGGFEAIRAESRVMARFAVETREGGTGHDCGHPDHIGWIEGPFARKPSPRGES